MGGMRVVWGVRGTPLVSHSFRKEGGGEGGRTRVQVRENREGRRGGEEERNKRGGPSHTFSFFFFSFFFCILGGV